MQKKTKGILSRLFSNIITHFSNVCSPTIAAAFGILSPDRAFYLSTLGLLKSAKVTSKLIRKDGLLIEDINIIKIRKTVAAFLQINRAKVPLWSTINLTQSHGTTKITPLISETKPYTHLKHGYCYFRHKRNILIKIIQRVTYLKIHEYIASRSSGFFCVAHEMK